MHPDHLCDLPLLVTNCSHSEREFKIMSAVLPWIPFLAPQKANKPKMDTWSVAYCFGGNANFFGGKSSKLFWGPKPAPKPEN
jgi:hypothetical protein